MLLECRPLLLNTYFALLCPPNSCSFLISYLISSSFAKADALNNAIISFGKLNHLTNVRSVYDPMQRKMCKAAVFLSQSSQQ